MANKKSSKKAAARTLPSASQIVTFKKQSKEGALPKQAQVILDVVEKSAPLTVAALRSKLEGKITTKQSVETIFSFYRNTLVSNGYVKIEKATEKRRRRLHAKRRPAKEAVAAAA